jgi:hypothetical protein
METMATDSTGTGEIAAFIKARLDEDEAAAREASGGTVTGEPGNWRPAPGGDEWEVHPDLTDGDLGPDGDLELLVALRPNLPRPPDVMAGHWGAVISWESDPVDPDASVPVAQLRHAALHDPARVLREVEADRRLLDLYERAKSYRDRVFARPEPRSISDEMRAVTQMMTLEQVLRMRAAVWSDHPDFRDEWRP